MVPSLKDASTAPDTLSGVLERIIYSNEQTHWMIGELRANQKESGITILGTLPSV